MRRVGFLPESPASDPVDDGTGQEIQAQADATDRDVESDAESDRKPTGRKSRRKADED